jgi:hypothetical protein
MHASDSDSVRRRIPKLDLESLSPDSFMVESDIVNMSAGWFPRVGTFRSIELSGSEGLIFHDGIFHQQSKTPAIPLMIVFLFNLFPQKKPMKISSNKHIPRNIYEQDFPFLNWVCFYA